MLAALATPCYAPQNIPRSIPPETRTGSFEQAQQNIPSAARPDLKSPAGQPGPCPATAITDKQLAELRALTERWLKEARADMQAFRDNVPKPCKAHEWDYYLNLLSQLGHQ